MEISEEFKNCFRCKKDKIKNSFSKDTRMKDGLRSSCKECLIEVTRRGELKYRSKEGYSELLKRSYRKNKKKRLDANVRRARIRSKNDIDFRLKERLRGRLSQALKLKAKKSASTLKLVGCSIQDLKLHLQSQFKEGMTWDNYGKNGWEVDHIIPCASFDFKKIEDQQKCFHYSNLQPLWKSENASKGAKITTNKCLTDKN